MTTLSSTGTTGGAQCEAFDGRPARGRPPHTAA
jgi:hypothetical protein